MNSLFSSRVTVTTSLLVTTPPGKILIAYALSELIVNLNFSLEKSFTWKLPLVSDISWNYIGSLYSSSTATSLPSIKTFSMLKSLRLSIRTISALNPGAIAPLSFNS